MSERNGIIESRMERSRRTADARRDCPGVTFRISTPISTSGGPFKRPLVALLCFVLFGLMDSDGRGQDPFVSNIRPTEPLSPAEQQKAFHLPEGFEIQLFAAEPDIQKPINMALPISIPANAWMPARLIQ